jgi:exonuclease SbcC
MIPNELQLKNFLSYGPKTQTIHLENHHLICLSGKNGHGKSALLDAITWVLWGQARKTTSTSKADDGLLHLGQTHMIVSLDFFCKGQRYRVRREYGKLQAKSTTKLDFGIYDDTETQKLRSLTEKTTKKTQESIVQHIGFDFESFTNSVFLRQGRSNEFSQKSAKERKVILANILGLDEYETLKKRALEKNRSFTQQKEQYKHVQSLSSLQSSLESTL